jgi:hypothetical protein
MAKGRKTGGRSKGTPNKVSNVVRDIWQRLGGPDGEVYAQQLHNIATAPHGDVHARIKALSVIAPYVWKKLAEQVEVTGTGGGPLEIRWKS